MLSHALHHFLHWHYSTNRVLAFVSKLAVLSTDWWSVKRLIFIELLSTFSRKQPNFLCQPSSFYPLSVNNKIFLSTVTSLILFTNFRTLQTVQENVDTVRTKEGFSFSTGQAILSGILLFVWKTIFIFSSPFLSLTQSHLDQTKAYPEILAK